MKESRSSNVSPDVFDPVDRPAHYAAGVVECIEAIEAIGIGIPFCRGNAIKYLWRLGRKGAALQDARKARWYVDRLVRLLEAEEGECDD